MTDAATEGEIIEWIETLFEDQGSSYEIDEIREDARGWRISVKGESNPFKDKAAFTHVSLMTLEARYRCLEFGSNSCPVGEGWTIHYQCLRSSYGEWVEVPDDNYIEAWLGPREVQEQGLEDIEREAASVLALEASRCLERAEMIIAASPRRPENSNLLPIRRTVGSIMRAVLCR